MNLVYPVIAKLPYSIKVLKRQEKKEALSQLGQKCAQKSALQSKLSINQFKKDVVGVPLPSNDIYWSISHKAQFAAGVVSKSNIGIDIEKIKDVSKDLFAKVLCEKQALLFKKKSLNQNFKISFFRSFTAKEAVLKLTKDGLKGLSKVTIKKVIDDKNLVVKYLNQEYLIESFFFDNYLASITKNNCIIKWILFDKNLCLGEKNE